MRDKILRGRPIIPSHGIVSDGYTRGSLRDIFRTRACFDRAAARRGLCRNLCLGKNPDCLNRCFDVNDDVFVMGE